ncbi:adenylate cyclase [bacterium]|nr:adenylate cyclase [bacterium]
MGLEIERKFLVNELSLPPLIGGDRLIQGYLSLSPQVRFRIKEDQVTLAVKSQREGISRFEFEATKKNVSGEEINELVSLAILPLIEKTRFRIPFKGYTWEIDKYGGANLGLVTAEVELPSCDSQPSFPDWIKSEMEVSADPRFFNTNLAQTPFSTWRK